MFDQGNSSNNRGDPFCLSLSLSLSIRTNIKGRKGKSSPTPTFFGSRFLFFLHCPAPFLWIWNQLGRAYLATGFTRLRNHDRTMRVVAERVSVIFVNLIGCTYLGLLFFLEVIHIHLLLLLMKLIWQGRRRPEFRQCNRHPNSHLGVQLCKKYRNP